MSIETLNTLSDGIDPDLIDLDDLESMEDLPQEHQLAHKIGRRIRLMEDANNVEGRSFWDDPKLGISSSSIKLDPEQAIAIRGIYANLRAGKNRLYLEAPTGWGKTIAAYKLMELLRDQKGNPVRAAIVVDDQGGLRQWLDGFYDHSPVLGKAGVHAGAYVGAYYQFEKDLSKPTVIVTYNSFIEGRKNGIFPPDMFDVIFLDEGHKSLTELRREMLDDTHAVQIALSATPSYSREKSLERYFVCAYRCSPQKAEALGMIAPFANVILVQPRVTLDNTVVSESGTFETSELRKRFKKAHLTQSFLNWYATWKPSEAEQPLLGRQGIINCLSVEHADEVAAEINAALKDMPSDIIPAVSLNGNTPKKLREWAEKFYRQGKILMLCGDELFTEGFDAPNVDFVFNMAPSTSGVKVGQRGGRARRIDRTGKNPNKIGYIVDVLYNNQSPHGWQLLYREWVESRLIEPKFINFEAFGPKQDKPKATQEAKPLKAIKWENVPADEIIFAPEALDDLIAWRERRWRELRPAPAWSSRFPAVWKAMLRNNIFSVKTLQELAVDTYGVPKTLFPILKGNIDTYDPERYQRNWHPACLAAARILNVHVRDLFPVPDKFMGIHDPSPQAQKKFAVRNKVNSLLVKAGFKDLTELARFVGFTPQRINQTLNAAQENLRNDGSWTEASQKIAEALLTSPEKLFGLPGDVINKLYAVSAMAHTGTEMPRELTVGLVSSPSTPAVKENEIFRTQVRRIMKELMLSQLTPREERVIQYQYFSSKTQPQHAKEVNADYTLEDISANLGCSRERVRQLGAKAERKLTGTPSRARLLRGLLDSFDLL